MSWILLVGLLPVPIHATSSWHSLDQHATIVHTNRVRAIGYGFAIPVLASPAGMVGCGVLKVAHDTVIISSIADAKKPARWRAGFSFCGNVLYLRKYRVL